MRFSRGFETFCKLIAAVSVFFLVFMVTSFGTLDDVETMSSQTRSFYAKLEIFKETTGEPPAEDRLGQIVHGKNFITFYNAIPKTGSRSLDAAIIKIAAQNPGHLKFQLIPPTAFANGTLLNDFVTSRKVPSFVRGHAMYKEFRSGPDVVYINVVRDPVERVISNYYFDVYGDKMSDASHGRENWPESIDDCVKMPSHRCNDAIKYYAGVTLRQFCGMDERCKVISRWTLERAKRNLKRYTIVGLSSDMDNILKAIEILLPDMYGGLGLQQGYSLQKNASKADTKTNLKRSPRPETIKHLRRRMDLQYEFFHHVNVRYNRVKSDLNLK